jgi:hypothetical protein
MEILMPYDPQRSHRRPRLADDGPAPIDALLDHAEPGDTPLPTGGETAALASASPSVRVPVTPPPAADPVFVDEVDLEVATAAGRGRPRVVVLAAALLVALLVLFWARRRR